MLQLPHPGRVWRALVVLAPLAVLSACGGGGGDSESISLSTSRVSFSASRDTLDARPAPQRVTATVKGVSGTLYLRVEVAGEAVTVGDVRVTSETTGEATLYPANPANLGPGDHRATVTVYACTTNVECTTGQISGSPLRIEVDYKVSGLIVAERELEYTVGNTVVSAELSKSVSIGGYPDANWTVTSDADWLLPSRTAGDSATLATLTAQVDEQVLETLNNGVYRGKMTVTPTAGNPVDIEATLRVARTETRLVSPGVEVAGSAKEVILRGDNFDAVTVTGVRFGSVEAASFRQVSPTEIRAVHPALPAGTYPVTVETAENLGRHLSTLSVYNPAVVTAAVLAYPPVEPEWYPHGATYDALRHAVLVGLRVNDGSGSSRVLRYVHNGTSWERSAVVVVEGGLTSLALSMDGQRLLTAAGSSIIRQHDPVTLAVLNTSQPGSAYYNYMATLPLTNDGHVLGALSSNASGYMSLLKYSIRDADFLDAPDEVRFFDGGISVASVDGSTVLMGSRYFAGEYHRYDASTDTYTALPSVGDASGLATDRTGARFLINHSGIYDRNLSLLGRLPDQEFRASVLSQDGSRAYAVDLDRKLWAFSLSSVVGGAVSVTQIGAPVTLIADPSPNDGFSYPPVFLAISPDGGTLIISGNQRTVVMPTP